MPWQILCTLPSAIVQVVRRRKMNFRWKRLSVGVVIPCHNNARQLYGVLMALRHQSERPQEVVVVDDNSQPGEERRLRALSEDFGAGYHKLQIPKNDMEALGRRSHARNAGTKCLDTDLVLYLDGDMLLGPKYVEEIKRYHAALQGVYIRGRRSCVPRILQDEGMDACLERITQWHSSSETSWSPAYMVGVADYAWRRAYRSAYYDKWEWCASSNLSVRNDAISRIGYWDENFVGWGEEDVDFSYRLYRSGLVPLFLSSNNATAYHLEHDIDHKINRFTLKINARYILSKFPEIVINRKDAYAAHDIDIDDL